MKLLRVLPPALLGLQLILPVCEVIAFLAGMEFTIYNVEIYAIVSTALMLIAVVVLFVWEPQYELIYLAIPPAALVNSFLWFGGPSVLVVFLAPVNAIAAIALLLRRGKKWKIIVSSLCILPALSLGWLGAVSCFFSGWVEDTVVRELPSPDGRYTAQVINRNAMEIDTLVEIQNVRKTVKILIGEFTAPARSIYLGERREIDTIQIEWQDEDTLFIDGEYYHVEGLS